MVEIKRALDESKKKEYLICFIWDSLASTPSSKDADAEDPDKVIGFRARELSFLIHKFKPLLALNRITFIIIDQVRSNLKISKGPYAKAEEKSVGQFSDEFKTATNVVAFQHALKQWLFLSKGTTLKPNEGFGVDGWEINIHTEKNKVVPSQYSIKVVFDKKFGMIPLFSEYLFLSDMTKSEVKFTKNDATKLAFPLAIKTVGNSKVVEIVNPKTGEVYTSDKFTERKLWEKYNSDSKFKKLFDYAVDVSVQERINKGLPVFDGRLIRTPKINLRYGEEPEVEHA
jgi:RecA/RadA recombinase